MMDMFGLNKLDNLQEMKNLEALKNMQHLDQLQHMDQLEHLQQLPQLQHMDQLQHIESLDKLQPLNQLQHLDKLSNLQVLNKLQNLDMLKYMQHLDQLHYMDHLQQLQLLNRMGELEKLNQLQNMQVLKTLSRLESLNHMRSLDELPQLSNLHYMENLKQLDNLHRLQQLEVMNRLRVLDRLLSFNFIGLLYVLSIIVPGLIFQETIALLLHTRLGLKRALVLMVVYNVLNLLVCSVFFFQPMRHLLVHAPRYYYLAWLVIFIVAPVLFGWLVMLLVKIPRWKKWAITLTNPTQTVANAWNRFLTEAETYRVIITLNNEEKMMGTFQRGTPVPETVDPTDLYFTETAHYDPRATAWTTLDKPMHVWIKGSEIKMLEVSPQGGESG